MTPTMQEAPLHFPAAGSFHDQQSFDAGLFQAVDDRMYADAYRLLGCDPERSVYPAVALKKISVTCQAHPAAGPR
jgi:hypothetical protein